MSAPPIAQDTPSSLMTRLAQGVEALSPAHRKIADFVLAHPFRAATMGIEDLAAAAEVSVATVNRFARRLGFGGYPELRGELLERFHQTLAPVEKLRATQMRQAEGAQPILLGALGSASGNLDQAAALLAADGCARAVDLVLEARRVVTVGLGVSAVLARLVGELLAPYCPAVEVLDGFGGPELMIRHAQRLGVGDLLVPITVPRYSRTTVDLLVQARPRGARALGFTDSAASPIVPHCDAVLLGPADHPVLHGSVVAIVALAEGLTAAVAARRQTVSGAAELTERILPYLFVDDGSPPRLDARRPRPPARSTPSRDTTPRDTTT